MTLFSGLAGTRVLDLTNNLAGPFATMILADLGADVIKVERPGKGDDTRSFPPHGSDGSVVFSSVNRNKRSIALDLKEPAAHAALLEIGQRCDVVVESFRAGKAGQLGLGHEDFKARNDSVVYCSISAFGTSPSGQGLPGYDPLVQAFCGIMSTTGQPGAPPTRVAASLIDLSTGMWAALAIVAALHERTRTGEGQFVEATLVDTGFMLMCHQIGGYLATGDVPVQLGSGSPITAPYEAFQTADGWVMIAAGNDELFGRLCHALELDVLLEDARFGSVRGRTAERIALHEVLEQRLRTGTSEHWIAHVGAAGVPIGPVNRVDEAIAHRIVAERGLLVHPQAEGRDVHPTVRLPVTANGQLSQTAAAPPTLGEHTAEVLLELGFAPERVEALVG